MLRHMATAVCKI